MKGIVVAVVGATGLVGREMVSVLESRGFPVRELRLFQSANGAAREFRFHGATIASRPLAEEWFVGVDLAFFATDEAISRREAPRAAAAGTVVIDNSSAFRLHDDVPLIVPEVNAGAIAGHHGIIANPNCAMAELVLVLGPLERAAGLRRVIVSTYQSVSGAGAAAEEALRSEVASPGGGPGGRAAGSPFAHPIAFNLIPEIGAFDAEGWCGEERKIRAETRKVLGRPDLDVVATVVRVPVFRGHAESVTVDLARPFSAERARKLLASAPGIQVRDDPARCLYPTPRDVEGTDDVLVGRIRNDPARADTLHLWIVGDNLRKGAALNAVQIAELALSMAARPAHAPLP